MLRLRRTLAPIALAILLGIALFTAFWGPAATAPNSAKLRGLDLVSFWAPATVLDRGDGADIYTKKPIRAEFKKLHPSKPPGYPIGYPPPIYQLFSLPQPALGYLDTVRAILLAMPLVHALAALWMVAAVRVPLSDPRRGSWRELALGFAIAAPGAISTIVSGQLGGVWTLSAAIALWAWSRGRRPLAGVALAVLWMKPTLALPMVLTLVLLGEGTILSSMVAGGAAMLALSLAAHGTEPWLAYFHRMSAFDKALDDFWIYRHRQVNVRGLVGILVPSASWRESLGWIAAGGATLYVGWVSVATKAAATSDALSADLRRGLVLAAALVAGPHMFEYDLGLDVFAMAVSLAWLWTGRASWRRAGWLSLGAAWAAPLITSVPYVSKLALPTWSLLFWIAWMTAELVLPYRYPLLPHPKPTPYDPASSGSVPAVTSAPSLRPSPSESAVPGAVPALNSAALSRPSPSVSAVESSVAMSSPAASSHPS